MPYILSIGEEWGSVFLTFRVRWRRCLLTGLGCCLLLESSSFLQLTLDCCTLGLQKLTLEFFLLTLELFLRLLLRSLLLKLLEGRLTSLLNVTTPTGLCRVRLCRIYSPKGRRLLGLLWLALR
jgi:hypothetical protein